MSSLVALLQQEPRERPLSGAVTPPLCCCRNGKSGGAGWRVLRLLQSIDAIDTRRKAPEGGLCGWWLQ
jgi:hypothetical protein